MENSSTRQILLLTLRSLGYTTLELLLTPLQYGIPNSRLRYYLLAKLRPMAFPHVLEGTSNDVWRHIPGQLKWIDHRLLQTSPEEVCDVMNVSDGSVRPVKEYLDYEQGASCSHPIPDKVLFKYGRLFDIVLPSSKQTCCFTRGWPAYPASASIVISPTSEQVTLSS
jgi:tRNA (cytosine38-C5)-methyltransferase